MVFRHKLSQFTPIWKLFLYCLFLSFNQYSQAQDYPLQAFTIEDGLPENTANALLQDSKGQLWIGTQAGVAVYDGARFKVYGTLSDPKRRLTNNMIESLYEASNGEIFIGTRHGMHVFNPQQNEIQPIAIAESDKYDDHYFKNAFLEDDEFVWFITYHNIFKYNKTNKEVIRLTQFTAKNVVDILELDNQKLVAIDSAVYQFSNDSFIKIQQYDAMVTGLELINKKLWVCTLSGLFDLSNGLIYPEFSSVPILYARQDKSGKKWIGTTKGLAIATDSIVLWQRTSNNNHLLGDLQLAWLQDKNGLIWLGTSGGLCLYNPEQSKILRGLKEYGFSLPSDMVNSITYSPKLQKLGIATENGVSVLQLSLDKENTHFVSQTTWLENQPINYIHTDIYDRFWIGTKSGKAYYLQNDQLFAIDGFARGIRGFYTDSVTNTTYMAGSEGIYQITEDLKLSQPEWLKEITYTAAMLPIGRNILVSHLDKIFTLDLDNKTLRTDNYGMTNLPSTMLTHQYFGDSLTYFSSISGGVFSYNPTSKIVGQKQVLDGINVWSIYRDNQNRFWSSTDAGVTIHTGDKILRILTEEDGLNYDDFRMTAHAQLSNGTLVFGNANGLSIIQPESIETDAWNAEIYISKLEVNYNEIPVYRAKEDFLLEPDENTITFYLGMRDLLLAPGASIRYKLNNPDADWSPYMPLSYPISFTGLNPGKYGLDVQVKDKSGRVSTINFHQNFEVLPHFYQTWWFRLILLGLLLFLVYQISTYRIRQNKKAVEFELKTEQAIRSERERISRDIHDSIGSRLTKIITDLDILSLKSGIKSVELETDLEKTRDYTQETINNLRETIWTVDTKIVRYQDLLHQTRAYLTRYLPESIQWTVDFEASLLDKSLSPAAAVNLFRILQELAQNMLKYSKATMFEIDVKGQKEIVFVIKDNGIGFDMETASTGEGMSNIRIRLEEINGKLAYHNDSGSRFEIVIPA